MACTRLHSSTRVPLQFSPLPRSPFLLIAWLPVERCVEPTMPRPLQARARCHRARQSWRAPVKRKPERRRDSDQGASRAGQEISQIGNDNVGAVSAQLARLSNAIDADHAAE